MYVLPSPLSSLLWVDLFVYLSIFPLPAIINQVWRAKSAPLFPLFSCGAGICPVENHLSTPGLSARTHILKKTKKTHTHTHPKTLTQPPPKQLEIVKCRLGTVAPVVTGIRYVETKEDLVRLTVL